MQLPVMEMVIGVALFFGFLWLVRRIFPPQASMAALEEATVNQMLAKILATLRDDRETIAVTKETEQPLGFPALIVTPYALTSQRLKLYYWGDPECGDTYAVHMQLLGEWWGPRITIVKEDWNFKKAGRVLNPSRLAREEEHHIRQIIILAEQLIRDSNRNASVAV